MTIDSCGRQATFEEPPRRVLTVASVAAPLVAAAGAANMIIARTFETASFLGEYEDELADVPLVSRTEELSREEIIAREPDLVIAYGGSDNAPQDLEAAAAATEVAELRDRIAAVEERPASTGDGRSAAALIFGRDTPTISVYGDRSTVDQQLQLLGLTNVFGDADERVFEPNIEEIIQRDPEVIILLTHGTRPPRVPGPHCWVDPSSPTPRRSATTRSWFSPSASPGRVRSLSKASK